MLSKISIKRPVTTVMVLLMVVLAGILAYTGLNLNLMPTIDIPIAIVSTSYTGAGPEEIENLITEPIEEAMGSISNVDKIMSTSSSGSSFVMIQFVDGTDIDMAAIDIREKIDMVKRTLPDDASDPMVMKMDMNALPITIGITSETLDLVKLNDLIEDNVVSSFERIEGVSAVTPSGGIENEIQVTINPDKMSGYGVTSSQIAQVFSSENINLPSGQIDQGEFMLQIRTVGQFRSIDEIKNLPIATRSGAVIHLSDVADVEQVQKDKNSYVLVNGQEGILLSMDKQSTANLVDISDKIVKTMNSVGNKYPEIKMTMLTSTADYIKTSVNNVTVTAFQSALVAIIVLLFFLKDPKTSLIIGVSIPTSILATFALMYLQGMTLNIISMGGIVIGIGMLVDNSIVVLENIFKYWHGGMDPKKSSQVGSSEVGMAVTASTLTTIAVFFPLLFVEGSVGQMLKDLSYTICFALISSLVVSLTFVPMACSKLLSREETKVKGRTTIFTKFLNAWGNGLDKIDFVYRKVLVWSLKNKKKVVALVFVCFVGTLALTPLAGFDFMPAMDEGATSINIEMPNGSKIEETQLVVDEVLKIVDSIEEKDLVYASVGGGFMGGGTDSASVTILLKNQKERMRSTQEVSDEIKEKTASIPGTEITISSSSMGMGSFGGATLSLMIKGDNVDTLKYVGEDIMDLIAEIEGTKDITSSAGEAIPEAKITINREKASIYGVSTAAISNAINTAISGTVATKYKIDGTEMDVRIRYDRNNVNYINDLKNITVDSSTGTSVPLSELASVQVEDGPISISRENQSKYITIEANLPGTDAGTFRKLVEGKIATYAFPEGYSVDFGGNMESMMEAFNSLFIVFIVAILLVYMIMASQFESLIYPFIIMFSMPLAITGGILGLIVTRNTISVTAFMGFIMLVGMVVNNAIVLVDYTNQLIENKNLTCVEALTEAGPSRLRPILMTTLTTIIGLVPMAIGTGEGMEMQQPLGIAVIFGLTISTLITLIFIPVLYAIVDKLRFKYRKEKKKKKKEKKNNIAELKE